jgi:hypothetical protein
VQRKNTLKAKALMRNEEVVSHRDIVRKDLAVQNALQEEMNELNMVREARASLGALLGRYMEDMDQTMEKHAQGDIKLMKGVRVLHDRFAKHLKRLMDHVYNEVKKEHEAAEGEMQKVAVDINKEAKEEEDQEDKYEKEMQDEPDKEEMEHEAEAETSLPPDSAADATAEATKAGTGSEEETIRKQLSTFFTKFREAQGLRLQPDAFKDWSAFWETEVVKLMEESNTEEAGKARADLVEKMKKKIAEQPALAYVESTNGPPQRFFENVLDANHALEPELATAITELETKYNLPGENAGKKHRPLEIVSDLEKIAEKHPKLPLRWMWADDKDELPEFNEEESYDQAKKDAELPEEAGGSGDVPAPTLPTSETA